MHTSMAFHHVKKTTSTTTAWLIVQSMGQIESNGGDGQQCKKTLGCEIQSFFFLPQTNVGNNNKDICCSFSLRCVNW